MVSGSVPDVPDAAGTAYGKFKVLAVRHEVDGGRKELSHFEAIPAAVPPPTPRYVASGTPPELTAVINLADPAAVVAENRLLGWPAPTAPDQVWVGGNTYVPLVVVRWCYLVIWHGTYSRRVVGWHL